jgi:uncharacterized membrane protein
MGWTEFAAAFAAFFLTHALPVRPPLRPWLVARLGPRGFGLAYSALSLAVLAWLIGAAGRAPYVPLWPWAPWQLHVPLAAMLPVCLILALAVGRPNPFSFGGARNDAFDPARPGIVRLTRHPLLLALAIWAFAHVVPNGDLAHGLLFGTFAVFALVGGRLVDRRKRREMGEDWTHLDAARKAAPLPPPPRSWPGLVLRLALGVALYLGLLWLHPWLFAVSPLP